MNYSKWLGNGMSKMKEYVLLRRKTQQNKTHTNPQKNPNIPTPPTHTPPPPKKKKKRKKEDKQTQPHHKTITNNNLLRKSEDFSITTNNFKKYHLFPDNSFGFYGHIKTENLYFFFYCL